ncbi:MAG: Lipopolysaccharide export system permease protein LptG [Alphaproteobacteria bacterium ADurb.Bin438]|nr:MAG: Lipopolysaccharide export system permease protein LptG [Alphaproteobacteria bacterium ADurb.Bin438]
MVDNDIMIINPKRILQDDEKLTLKNASFIFTSKDNMFIKRIETNEALLQNGNFYIKSGDIYEAGLPPQPLNDFNIKTNLSLKKINENFASPESISFWDLSEFIYFFKNAGFSAHKHILYYNSLIVSPLLLCATAILAAAFSLSPNQRQIKVVTRVVIGISVAFLFFFITRVTYALGISSILPIALSVWSPVVIFIMLGVSVILHIEDG